MAEKEEAVESDFTGKVRRNPWMVSTIVLGILSLILLIFVVSPSLTGNAISTSSIGQQAVEFINTQLLQGQGNVTLDSVTKKNGLYEVTVNYNGNKVPTYFTIDGKNYIYGSLVPLTANTTSSSTNTGTQTQAAVPKTDKPIVDFYVFAYCPYGTQMEKALLPVYNLLKDKAEINIVYIGAMHGEYEHVESLRQIAILENYGKDKLFAYLAKFLSNTAIGSCNGVDSCVNPLIESIYPQIGIDKNLINSYMSKSSEAIYAADEQKASSNQVSGSPTVLINGVQASVGRSSSDVQTAICSAFNTAPSECSQTLSSVQESPGFGTSAGTGSSASCG